MTKDRVGMLRRLWLMVSPPSAEEKAAVALTDFIKDQRSPNPNAEAQLYGGVVDVD